MGQPSLGPLFCDLSGPAAALACIVGLLASTTAWAITSLVFFSLAVICICIISVYVCLCETFTTDTM